MMRVQRFTFGTVVFLITMATANAQNLQVQLGAGMNGMYPRSDGQQFSNFYRPGLAITAGFRYSILFSDRVFARTGVSFRRYTVHTSLSVQPKYGVNSGILPVEIGYTLNHRMSWTGGVFLQYAFHHELYGTGDPHDVSSRRGYPTTNLGLTTALQYQITDRWTTELSGDYVLGSSYDQTGLDPTTIISHGRWAVGLSVLYRLGRPK